MREQPDLFDVKTCNKCGETKPFSEFYKRKCTCKCCIAEYDKAYRQENKERIRANEKAYQQENREKIAEQKKAYRQENKEKIAEREKTYRQENKEKIAGYKKAYRQENKEKIAEREKAYRQENKERIAGYNKAYQQENKEKIAEIRARRRAVKRSAVPKFLRNCPLEKQRLVSIYKLRDIFSKATGEQYHVDHMWPLTDGGPHWSGNLQLLPAQENLTKHASVCPDIKATVKEALRNARQRYKVQEIRMEV